MIRSGKGEMRERGRGEKIVNSWCSKREPREIRTSVWRESVAEILNSGIRTNEVFFCVVRLCARKKIFLAVRCVHAPDFHFFDRAPRALILGIDHY
jgi:hypothetical protein